MNTYKISEHRDDNQITSEKGFVKISKIQRINNPSTQIPNIQKPTSTIPKSKFSEIPYGIVPKSQHTKNN